MSKEFLIIPGPYEDLWSVEETPTNLLTTQSTLAQEFCGLEKYNMMLSEALGDDKILLENDISQLEHLPKNATPGKNVKILFHGIGQSEA